MHLHEQERDGRTMRLSALSGKTAGTAGTMRSMRSAGTTDAQVGEATQYEIGLTIPARVEQWGGGARGRWNPGYEWEK